MSELPRQQEPRPRGLGAAARVTALAGSVMDLHVRIALQEVDREKRRLISGGVFLAMGGTLMLLALVTAEAALLVWMLEAGGWSLLRSLLTLAVSEHGCCRRQSAHRRTGAEGALPAADAGWCHQDGSCASGQDLTPLGRGSFA